MLILAFWDTTWGVLMRKFWVACGLVLFTLGILSGCGETPAPQTTDKPAAAATDKPAAAATDATKGADAKKASKPAPRKSAKPHSTSGK